MTASTASTPRVQSSRTSYLRQIFLHTRSRSREITAGHYAVLAATSDVEGEVIRFENTVGRFLAAIAEAAVDQLRRVEIMAPGYEGDETLASLRPADVDELVRPIFEASGIADDFIPWRESFPNFEEESE